MIIIVIYYTYNLNRNALLKLNISQWTIKNNVVVIKNIYCVGEPILENNYNQVTFKALTVKNILK